MWEIVSNPKYVADPAKGSIHNRGGAVDITLVDANNRELDMGTPFDFFWEEASHGYDKYQMKY
jgi:D-alanyl-D-alanine dipeptidase